MKVSPMAEVSRLASKRRDWPIRRLLRKIFKKKKHEKDNNIKNKGSLLCKNKKWQSLLRVGTADFWKRSKRNKCCAATPKKVLRRLGGGKLQGQWKPVINISLRTYTGDHNQEHMVVANFWNRKHAGVEGRRGAVDVLELGRPANVVFCKPRPGQKNVANFCKLISNRFFKA